MVLDRNLGHQVNADGETVWDHITTVMWLAQFFNNAIIVLGISANAIVNRINAALDEHNVVQPALAPVSLSQYSYQFRWGRYELATYTKRTVSVLVYLM